MGDQDQIRGRRSRADAVWVDVDRRSADLDPESGVTEPGDRVDQHSARIRLPPQRSPENETGARVSYETVKWEQDGGVGRIVLNRPETLNAWNTQFGQDLKDAVAAAAGDDSVRAVLLTGAGRAFSSGADLKAGFD